MITNFGKNLISKYLLGQIDSYANYIAIGTGGITTTPPAVTQQSLNFEAARYPVISKGVSVDSSNNRQLVFTAQIDSLDRFDITEIGLYPGAYDSLLSGSVGSKTLLDFSINELWNYNNDSSYNQPLTFILDSLDAGNTTNILDEQRDPPEGGTVLKSYLFDANNSFFTATRISRYEKPRMYDSSIIVLGDMSTTHNTGKYIELSGFSNAIDLDNASDSVDELRVAFNVINTTTLTTVPSGGVQFTIRFITNDGQTYREYVFDTANSLNTKTVWVKSLAIGSRYVVGKQTLDEGTSSGDFKWSAVNTVRIYAKATDSTSIANYAIIFDAIRFENNSTTNPLYGLIGYSVPLTNVIKESDTSGLIEFRFNLGVA
jgi:hypothetical protein